METLQGSVENVLFSSEDTGFAVAKFRTKEAKDPVCITGILPGLQPGESLLCRGEWKRHAQYGRQFEVTSFEPCVPTDLIGIKKYLESGLVKGIGPGYAGKIVAKFGLSTLKIIDEDPKRLMEIPGIGEKRIEKIATGWNEQKSLREVMVFLRGHGIGAGHAGRIYKTYKDATIATVSGNPFILTKEVFGIGFKTADALATALGITKDSPKRIDAGIEFVFRQLAGEGHTCYPAVDFLSLACATLDIPSPLAEERITFLTKQELLIRENDRLRIGRFHRAEQTIAGEIKRITSFSCSLRKVDTEKAVAWAEEKLRIRMAKEQSLAVKEALQQKMMILTGGPGTGKSTITKAILRISEKLTSKILLAAPTGRAAKRMSEITRKKAFTLHAILEWDPVTGQFKRNGDNPLSCDLLIIDEASMIDTLLMSALLKAVPSQCRVLLIGDVDQLPSVGPGSVLKDLIVSDALPVVRLQRIFRQGPGSRITLNAHKVNRGYMPDLEPIPDSDFLFITKEDAEEIALEIVRIAEKNGRAGNFQVLSPMKKGPIGIDRLNTILQERLNPSDSPFLRLGRRFHLYDKVMQIRNNYDKEVFNGDIGTITGLDSEEGQIEVTFDDKPVLYESTEIDELVLAYAVSIHKYQGSECEHVVIPVHTSHFKLLNKNLLYTAITRGKKLVTLIGTVKAVAIAVHTEGSKERYTGLQERMRELSGS